MAGCNARRDREDKLRDLLGIVGDWYDRLKVLDQELERELSSPLAALLLSGDSPSALAGTASMATAPESVVGLMVQLVECQSQEGVCEILARGNDGQVDLRDTVPYIRKAGLSEARSDRGLIKNLGNRLVGSGRWDRVAPARYRLKNLVVTDYAMAGSDDFEDVPSEVEVDSTDGVMLGVASRNGFHADDRSCFPSNGDLEEIPVPPPSGL